MAATVKVENFPAINAEEKTRLDADAAAGATSITVESAQNVSVDDFIYIGAPGQEKAEKRQVTAVSGAVLTVAALTFAHKKFTRVLAVKGDQIQLYRAANADGTAPADSSFSVSGSPVDIDPDEVQTALQDATGGSGFWYKWRYWNSDSAAAVTDLDDVLAVRGRGTPAYASVEEIRTEAGIQGNPYISDAYVAERRLDAQAEIDAALQSAYTVPFDEPAPALIRDITVKLAAGRILLREYGAAADGTSKDGEQKLKEARELLARVKSGELDLTDASGASISSTSRVQGWPNEETEDADVEDGGAARSFRIGNRY